MDLFPARLGVALTSEGIPATELTALARAIEDLGYGALWLPEQLGREAFSTMALLLGATTRLRCVTGVLDIHARDPLLTAMGQQTLAELSHGRFVLGLGVSDRARVESRGHAWTGPLGAMREYVAALRQAHTRISLQQDLELEGEVPQPVARGEGGSILTAQGELPLLLAALGPHMLALAAEMQIGVHPVDVSPEHTRMARTILGPLLPLCPLQRVCLGTDPRRARAAGRRALAGNLARAAFQAHYLRQGFHASDFEHGGSDRLIDALVAWGEPTALAAAVSAQLAAGATHVCVQPIDVADPTRPCLQTLALLQDHLRD